MFIIKCQKIYLSTKHYFFKFNIKLYLKEKKDL
jgi:hypothetical protein